MVITRYELEEVLSWRDHDSSRLKGQGKDWEVLSPAGQEDAPNRKEKQLCNERLRVSLAGGRLKR